MKKIISLKILSVKFNNLKQIINYNKMKKIISFKIQNLKFNNLNFYYKNQVKNQKILIQNNVN